MSQKTVTTKPTSAPLIIKDDVLQRLCALMAIETPLTKFELADFTKLSNLAELELNKRIVAALHVFINMVAGYENKVERIDRVLLDHFIAKIDETLNKQMDAILHDPQFKQLESTWRGLKYLIDQTDFNSNIKLEILDVDKEKLRDDFADADEITQTGLYHHIYDQEYDMPGGEPITAIIADYEFSVDTPDIQLLRAISKVASVTHAPFIAAVNASFFNKSHIEELTRIDDLTNYMARAEYIRWQSFRETEDARYIGLTLPRFLLRLPYGNDNPTRSFNYLENVAKPDASDYLWGNASFAFAVNMVRSFKQYGWAVNIRGPESGGKVEGLPLHQYDAGRGLLTKIPTEILIPETRELELANLGFIPLSYYKNSDYACFFSANSVQQATIYQDPEATANSRVNARLPYIFLSARLAHYLKVLQRENIGTNKNQTELEQELNAWLQTLVTKMINPDPELSATHPLREGKVIVTAIPDNPGFHRVTLYAMPHFQIEGVDVRLSLVAQMPKLKDQEP